jgi:hypothetical protein
MQSIAMEFVIDPLVSGEHEARYRHVSVVRPDALLERMAATQFYRLSGGYCVVVDGMIWNASPPLPYNPAAVDCIVDDVRDALVFLDALAGQAEDGSTLKAYFTEMLAVEIRPGENGELLLSGAAIIGPVRLPEICVAAEAFYGTVYQASREFIAFAEELAGALRSSRPRGSDKEEWRQFESGLAIEQWERAAERLRKVLAG